MSGLDMKNWYGNDGGRHYSTVTKIMVRMSEKIKENQKIRQEIKK